VRDVIRPKAQDIILCWSNARSMAEAISIFSRPASSRMVDDRHQNCVKANFRADLRAGGMEHASDELSPYVDHIGPATLLLSDSSVMGVLRMPGAPPPW